MQNGVQEFLEDREDAYLTCCNLYNPEQSWSSTNTKGKTYKPASLYYTSLTGLIASVGTLLDKGADVNAQGGDYGTALQAASARGHYKIVQVLPNRGADIVAEGGRHVNALYTAS